MLDQSRAVPRLNAAVPSSATHDPADTGFRFSWGLAFAGGIAAVSVTFLLLTLGSGLGLMLVRPIPGAVPATSGFFTGGAVYFFVAQAFGFAVGGHLAGRLLGPIIETDMQETFRAVAHGLVAWSIAVLSTLTIIGLVGASTVGNGASLAALYVFQSAKVDPDAQTAYLVDVLFRPDAGASASMMAAPVASDVSKVVLERAEAGRILTTSLMLPPPMQTGERDRLAILASSNAGITKEMAQERISALESDVRSKAATALDYARRVARNASLWLAASLLFGALIAMFSAVLARLEDDRESVSEAVVPRTTQTAQGS